MQQAISRSADTCGVLRQRKFTASVSFPILKVHTGVEFLFASPHGALVMDLISTWQHLFSQS
jgi:hypothetical protein